jgi:hypothetical protein
MAVYQQDDVVLPALDVDTRERLALALWDQQWVTIRKSFTFCTAPGAAPRTGTKRSLRFSLKTAPEPNGDLGHLPSEWDIVVSDLSQPTPFRNWLHFVGSGERDHRLMKAFALFYLLIQDDSNDFTAVRRAQDLLAEVGPQVTDLRRLKRRLLSFDRDLPRWGIDPEALLTAVGRERLGDMIAAEDASISNWLAYGLQRDRVFTEALVLELLERSPAPGPVRSRVTAKEGLASAAHEVLADLVTPATLPFISRAIPALVLDVLIRRDEVQLWSNWGHLPPDVRVGTLSRGTDAVHANWADAFRALRDTPEAIADLVRTYPETVIALADAVDDGSVLNGIEPSSLPAVAARLVRRGLETETDVGHLRALCYLADPSHLPAAAKWEAWDRALDGGSDVTAAIAYLLARGKQRPKPQTVFTHAFADLYTRLASSDAEPAWRRIRDQLVGDHSSWDRCRSLALDFAEVARSAGEDVFSRLEALVAARSADAAAALTITSHSKGAQKRKPFDWLPW